MNRARGLLILFVALALTPSLSAAVDIEACYMGSQSKAALGLGVVLWASVIYLILVYEATIRRSVRSKAWDTLVAGMILFVVGLILFQASVFLCPLNALIKASVYVPSYLPQLKMGILFVTALVIVLFLADWCRVFGLLPELTSRDNLGNAALAVFIALGGTLLPWYFNPLIELEERSYVFPIVGISVFILANVIITIMGFWAVRKSPVLWRFRWIMADSVFTTAFFALLAYEFWALPPGIRNDLYPHTLFYSFNGLFFLLVGYIFKLRALAIFIKTFMTGPPKPQQEEPEEAPRVSGDVLSYLTGKFIKTEELEGVVARTLKAEPALNDISFDPEDRTFDLSRLDLSEKKVQEAISNLFFACVELLLKLRPPIVDKEYTEGSLKEDITTYYTKSEERPPPAIEGFIIPKGIVVPQAVAQALDAFIRSIPSKAHYAKLVMLSINRVWGEEFVRSSDTGLSFDKDAFINHCDQLWSSEMEMARQVSTRYLRSHRQAFEPMKNVLSRENMRELLRSSVEGFATDPMYRTAGVADLIANAFFALSHPWGFEAIDRTAGPIPNRQTVLLVYDRKFPKEQFISRLLKANLAVFRNAMWVAQARHAITRRLLSDDMDVDTLLKEKRLILLSMDPNMEESREESIGCRTIGVSFNRLSYELKRDLDEFPVSSNIVVLELPVSALKETTTMLYKFVFHIKTLVDKYDATLLIAADATIGGEETVAMLKGIAEVVVEASEGQTEVVREAHGGVLSILSLADGTSARVHYDELDDKLIFSNPELMHSKLP